MKRNRTLIFSLFLSCACGITSALGVTMDLAMQKVLKDYGIESKILRSFDQAKGRSPTSDRLFPFELEGAPGIKLVLERDYWILASWSNKKDDDTYGYIFNPRDGQSALNISIGESVHDRTDAELSQMPGFSFIAHGEGNIAGHPVVWRRWSDQNHLYSDCALKITTAEGGKTKTYKVNVLVTANSVARRQALEACMPTLRLLKYVTVKEKAAAAPLPASKSS